MAVTTPLCPTCNADLMKVGIMPWNYVAGAAGNVSLLLCMHCSHVLGVLPGLAQIQPQQGLNIPGALA